MSTILQTEELLMDLQEAIIRGELCPKRDRVFAEMAAYMKADLNEAIEKSQEIIKPLPDSKTDLYVPFAI